MNCITRGSVGFLELNRLLHNAPEAGFTIEIVYNSDERYPLDDLAPNPIRFDGDAAFILCKRGSQIERIPLSDIKHFEFHLELSNDTIPVIAKCPDQSDRG